MTETNNNYEAGQVWEYRARPGEEGSLLKIQEISFLQTDVGDLPVYHTSIIGVRLGPDGKFDEISHVLLSAETLDASVTALSRLSPVFPDPAEGMEIWRNDEGGVFTLAVAEIVKLFDDVYYRH